MDETLSSLSDVRITSLITTSITDMVRQEVGKIMQDLNMPVCVEAIDRIIAENLDKEVEKQNFVKTYKKKLNKLNQYKCIEKHVDADEVVITNLQVIESRVKKLEDFVLQNLMQRPQLMQDLAVRSRENLVLTCEEQQKINENKCDGQGSTEKSEENQIQTVKPMIMNLDDVIKVIKECPETQDSFDIFQSAAERIKQDLERFIQDYKSDLGARARVRGREELEMKKIASSPESEDVKDDEISKSRKVIEADLKPPQYMIESVESVALISTSLDVSKVVQNCEREIDSNDTSDVQPPLVINMREAEQEIVRPTVEEITKVAMEATRDLQCEQHKSQIEKVEAVVKTVTGGDANSVAQHVLMTSMACGDKRIVDLREAMLLKAMQPQEVKNAKISQALKVEKEYKQCRECSERMHFMRERAKPYAIDEDIKWKLDKILDHIGDFCSRTRGGGGRESTSEPDRKTVMMNAQQLQPQPGTSADFTKRKMTRSSSVKPKQLHQTTKRSTGLNGKYDRKNLDRIMDQIRYMGHHMTQRQEVVITDVKTKMTPNTNATTNATADQPTKCKANKSIEQPRRSVEAFKTKWGLEYSKNSIVKATANHADHAKHAPKSTIPPRSTTEAIPKAAMKKRQIERSSLPPIPLQVQMPLPARPAAQQVVQKSSTTLMLESIDKLARSAAAKNARIARAGHTHEDVGWVYSRRSTPQAPSVNLSEVRRTKVLYHNYKL